MSTVASLQIRFGADIAEAQKAFRTLRGSLIPFERAMEAVGKKLTTHATAPMAIMGTVALKTSIDFESAFAGVLKTVDDATDQFGNLTAAGQVLEKGIRQLSTQIPVSAGAIARVVELGGQLGITTDRLLSFAEVMIGLAEASEDLTIEDAAMQLAQFANITQMSQGDFDRLASTIVLLGNKMSTTEGRIVDMGMRIATVGSRIGLTEGQIMGLAAALASLGIPAERGGTAISKLMIEIASQVATSGDKLEQFASIAGMSASDFQHAFEKDAAGAIVAFLTGLGRVEEQGGSTLAVMEAMGFTEVRLRETVLALAGSGDVLTKGMRLQAKGWSENIALQEEVARRYGTTESLLILLRSRLAEVARTFGDVLKPALRLIIDLTTPLIQVIQFLADQFARLPQPIQVVIGLFLGLIAAMGPLLIIAAKVASILNIIALGMLAWSAWTKLLAAFPALGMVVQGVLGLIGQALRRMALAFILAAGKAALLVAGFLVLKELIVRAKADFAILSDAASRAFGTIESSGKPALEGLKSLVQTVLDAMQGLWEKHSEFLLNRVRTAVEGVFTRIGIVLNGLAQVIATVLDLVQGNWSDAWNRMQFIAGKAVTVILGSFASILGGIQTFVAHMPGVGTAMAAGIDPAIAGLRNLSSDVDAAIADLVPDAGKVGVDMDALLDKVFGKPEKEPWEPDPTSNEKLDEFLKERARVLRESILGEQMDPMRAGALPDIGTMAEMTADFGPTIPAIGPGQLRGFTQSTRAEMAILKEQFAADLDAMLALARIWKEGVVQLMQSAVASMAAGFEAFFSTGSIAEGFKAFFGGILSALGDFLIKMGTAAIMASKVGIAIRAALTNPGFGFAAGAAAIALGAALKAASSSLASTGGGAGGGPSWRGAPGGLRSNPNLAMAGVGDPGNANNLVVQVQPSVMPSGDTVYAAEQGTRRRNRRGQPMV